MKPPAVVVLFILTAASFGCVTDRDTRAVTFNEAVIAAPESRDFGFVGKWRPLDSEIKTDDDVGTIIISMKDGVYSVKLSDSRGDSSLKFACRAASLAKDFHKAIFEMAYENEKGEVESRYLGIAFRNEDRLHVAWVQAKNFAKFMREDGYSAVIEIDTFETEIHANAEDVLACVRKHYEDLISESDQYERVAP